MAQLTLQLRSQESSVPGPRARLRSNWRPARGPWKGPWAALEVPLKHPDPAGGGSPPEGAAGLPRRPKAARDPPRAGLVGAGLLARSTALSALPVQASVPGRPGAAGVTPLPCRPRPDRPSTKAADPPAPKAPGSPTDPAGRFRSQRRRRRAAFGSGSDAERSRPIGRARLRAQSPTPAGGAGSA
jgi:hypothetical protein